MTVSPIISSMIEAGIMIYYSNKLFQPRHAYWRSNLWIGLGYLVLALITQFKIPALNMILFLIVNFSLIRVCFKTGYKTAIFQTVILTAMMMLGEGVTALIMNLQIEFSSGMVATSETSMIHGFMSKLIYFVAMVLLRNLFKRRYIQDASGGFLLLSIVPIATFAYFVIVGESIYSLNQVERIAFVVLSVVLLGANIIVYWVYDNVITKNAEIRELQAAVHKNELEYKNYLLVQEKSEEMRIMRHDFQRHMSILKSLVGSDNHQALSYLGQIQEKSEEASVVDCTESKILNILLAQKMELCHEKKIQFALNIRKAAVAFMEDIDIVSIFSNLIDNAIESCEVSCEKKISFELCTMNQNYTVIRIENSCDHPPKHSGGDLKTRKRDERAHGLGMKSIRKTLEKYNSELQWKYDEEKRRFITTVILRVSNAKSLPLL